MNTFTRWLAATTLLASPALASAQLLAAAEAYLSFGNYEDGLIDESTNGYGLRGRINLLGTGLFVQGSFTDDRINDNLDLTDTRLGGGIGFGALPLLDIDFGAEYVDLEFDAAGMKNAIDGYGVSVGAETELPILKAYGAIEYMQLEDDLQDYDGLEYVVGVRFTVLVVGVFAEYRMLTLEPDNGTDIDIDGFRVGVRASF